MRIIFELDGICDGFASTGYECYWTWLNIEQQHCEPEKRQEENDCTFFILIFRFFLLFIIPLTLRFFAPLSCFNRNPFNY